MRIPGLRRLKAHVFRACPNLHLRLGRRPDIFLFSTARSGSTWLYESIGVQRGMKTVNEPLLVSRPDPRGSPLPRDDWAFLLPNPARTEALRPFIRDLIRNRVHTGTRSPGHRLHRWLTWRIVFKVLRCQDMMNWFEREFGGMIVYLLRHPLPVALSRTRYDRLPHFLHNETYRYRYLDECQRRFADRILEKGTELEKKVLDWGIQNLVPLRFLDRSNWCCVHYEDLVLRPEETFSRVGEHLRLPDLDRMLAQYHRPSGSTGRSDAATQQFLERGNAEEDRSYLVTRWRSRVTPEEEERAFDILDKLRITVYRPDGCEPAERL